MAYTASSLIRIGGGSGQALWYYSSADTIADANTAGYFNDADTVLFIAANLYWAGVK